MPQVWSRWLLLLLATACGSKAPKPDSKTEPFTAVQAIHGQPIIAIAVTEDGTAAATADQLGALRLWPALDGSREPVVIVGAVPSQLAIVRDSDGFAVATLDAAHTVEIRRWSAHGQPRTRMQLERPAIELAATPTGFLVLLEDRAIDIVDARGELAMHLVPEPGTRVESLVYRDQRALAMIAGHEAVRGRWIDLVANAWGESTPPLGIEARDVVLSPDHHTLVGVAPLTQAAVVTDTATGLVSRPPICGAGVMGQSRTVPAGFFDAKTVVCAQSGVLTWWQLTGAQIEPHHDLVAGHNLEAGATAFVTGRVVTAQEMQLVFATPERLQFLGYETRDFPHVRYTHRGLLVGKGDQRATLLDASFQPATAITLPPLDGFWRDVVPIDARYVLTLSTTGDGETVEKSIGVYDTVAKIMGPLARYTGTDELLAYEPATNLVLTTESDGTCLVRRLDPITRALGEAVTIAAPHAYLVDPALAHGVAVAAIVPSQGGFIVTEILATELGHGHASYRVPGEFRAVDRTGLFYMTAGTDVVAYDRGAPTITLPDLASHVIRPSAEGTSIAAFSFAERTLTVFGRDGVARWSVPVFDVRDVQWLGAKLIGQFTSAFVEFDLATGRFSSRQCGWGFGLSDAPRSMLRDDGTVCDVAP